VSGLLELATFLAKRMTPQQLSRHSQPIHIVYANPHECGPLANALTYTLPVIGWRNTTLRRIGPSDRLSEVPARPLLTIALIGRATRPKFLITSAFENIKQTVFVGGKSAFAELARVASQGALSALNADSPFNILLDQLDHLMTAYFSDEGLRPDSRLTSALLVREHEARQIETLTDRECDVLGSLLIGATPAEIASVNRLSISTVRNHVNRVFQKLEVSSVQRACAVVLRSSCDPRLDLWVRSLADFRHHDRVAYFEQYR
jgi:DNA-binding NarL/FixJ family response regulator